MSNHTQGEWIVIKNGLNGRFSPPRKMFLINCDSGSTVSNVASIQIQHDEDDIESEANAKLIAAAPKLLEALEQLLYSTEMGDVTSMDIKRAKQAIKQATE